jgi:aryl-alcohol dehydrogenase-like predicted oxidoreductase
LAVNGSRQVGRSGLRISPIGLGTASFGREVQADQARRLAAAYLDAGGNHIDTADSYAGGAAEQVVAAVLQGRREEVVISGKVGLPLRPGQDRNRGARRHIRRAVEGSLGRLRTDRIDILHLHRWDGQTDLEETLQTLDDLVRWGMVDHVAVSNWAGWQVAWAAALAQRRGWTPPVAVQGRYSLAERDVEREILPYCRWAGLGFIAYSPLCGGLLTGKYVDPLRPPAGTRAAHPELGTSLRRRMSERNLALVDSLRSEAVAGVSPATLAISWLLRRRGVSGVVVGVTSPEQLADAMAAPDADIDPAVFARLTEACRLDRGYPQDLLTELDCDGDEARE